MEAGASFNSGPFADVHQDRFGSRRMPMGQAGEAWVRAMCVTAIRERNWI